MTIKDFLRPYRVLPNFDGEIGIEIETETKKSYNAPAFYFWTTHADNSLRDYGIEYVLKQPVKYNMVGEALQEFQEKTKGINFIKDSFSTSVHVHLNLGNEKKKTFGNFLTTYFLFENLLIRYSGPNRRSNLFCLPVIDAEDTYHFAKSMCESLESKNTRGLVVNEGAAKYAALNLSALAKYGSLEVRSFRGETDIKSIKEWVDILYSMLEYSRKMKNPKEIMEEYRKKEIGLKKDIFGKLADKLTVPDEKEIVDSNVFYAASVAYSVKDWAALDEEIKLNYKPTQKDLDGYSMREFGIPFNALSAGKQEFIYKVIEKMVKDGVIVKKTKSRSKAPLDGAWQQVEPVAAPNIWLDELVGNAQPAAMQIENDI